MSRHGARRRARRCGVELRRRSSAATAPVVALVAADRCSTSRSRPTSPRLQTLNVNLTQVCTIVIVGVGMTLVIATGGIDLSVGSLMAIAGALAPLIFLSKLFPLPSLQLGVALAFVVPVLVAGVFGLFNGWLITRFRIQPIIATLVLFIAGRGIAQVMTNGNLQVFKTPEFQFIGLGRVAGHPVPGLDHGGDRGRRRLGAAADACSAGRCSRSAATRRRRACRACRRRASSSWSTCISGLLLGHRRADRDRHQLLQRRQPGRPRHGAGRHRRRGRRRHAAHRRPRHRHRHAARRPDHPARPLHAARQRRARCRGPGGQGG